MALDLRLTQLAEALANGAGRLTGQTNRLLQSGDRP
jgi:hypothetical protein